MDSATYTIVDAVLTFAAFASFAIGPEGFIIAGALATIQSIFTKCLSNSPMSVPIPTSELVAKEIQENEIEDARSSFMAYSQWFNNYYTQVWSQNLEIVIPSDINSYLRGFPNFPFSTFYTHLQSALTDPGQPLLQNISLMQKSDGVNSGVNLQVKSFNTFLFGVSIYASFCKIYYLINRLSTGVFDKTYASNFANTLDGYIKYAQDTVNYIETQIQNRLNLVSQVKEFDGTYTTYMSGGSIPGLLYTDDGGILPDSPNSIDPSYLVLPANTVEFVANTDPKFFSKGTPNTDQVKKARTDYIKKLTQKEMEIYNYSEKDKINQAIQELQKLCNTFKKY